MASGSFLTKPGKAAKPTTTAGVNQLTLTTSVTGGGTLSKWQYQQKTGNGNFGTWTDISSTSTQLSHDVTGLTPGVNYQFKLRAVNATGHGAASDASDAATPLEERRRDDNDGDGSPADTEPSFASAAAIESRVYTFTQHVEFESLVLPAASGGDGALTYALTPALLGGLTFDAATRTLSGTPTEAMAETTYTYTATDADGDSASLSFTIAVEADLTPSFGSAAVADQVYTQHVEIEPYVLPVATGGNGALTYTLTPALTAALPAGLTFDPATRTLSGTPTEVVTAKPYTYSAMDADGDRTPPLTLTITVRADSKPVFAPDTRIADRVYTQHAVIEPAGLPAATGGNGALTYTLTPALPAGLTFDPATRVLSGTPTAASAAQPYTYSAMGRRRRPDPVVDVYYHGGSGSDAGLRRRGGLRPRCTRSTP